MRIFFQQKFGSLYWIAGIFYYVFYTYFTEINERIDVVKKKREKEIK